jgi:hypothetical protein
VLPPAAAAVVTGCAGTDGAAPGAPSRARRA